VIKTLRAEDLDGPLALLTGTRPGIIKFAPLFRELDRRRRPYLLIHSGQHYSPEMDAVFFADLQLRAPDHRLDMEGRFPLHGEQTAEMLKGIERILIEARPPLLLVGGDCNTHLAGALAARKLHIAIGHVEAGMRSYDWRMPEEHNRVMIDHISEHLFVHDEGAVEVLRGERVRGEIHVVGSTIADAVRENRELARSRAGLLERVGVRPGGYVLATIHREENVDDPRVLAAILAGLEAGARTLGLPIVFPAHPRTRRVLDGLGAAAVSPGLKVVEPFGYLDFLALESEARLIVTDSGGVQQEACILGVPCVTVRPSTEWTETVAAGANRLAPAETGALAAAIAAADGSARDWRDPFPAGAAARIVDIAEELITTGAAQLGLCASSS
jgi:UDP-N-acetylglucosamine 2-epimerase (non-hydrolysing)